MAHFKLILIIAFISLLSLSKANIIDDEKKYSSIDGTQIYMFETSTVFAYLSIDNTVTTNMKATMNFYSTTTTTDLSKTGLWSGIGFGTSVMVGSNMIICGMDIGSSLWCKQFDGKNHFIEAIANQTINVTASSVTDLKTVTGDYGSYVSKLSWSFTVNFSSTDLQSIISGDEKP